MTPPPYGRHGRGGCRPSAAIAATGAVRPPSPRGTRHAFKNLTGETATVLVFYTPSGPEQSFLDHGDDPDPSGGMPPPWTPGKIASMAASMDPHKLIVLPRADDWT